MTDELSAIIEVMNELTQDNTVPQGVRTKLTAIKNILQNDTNDLTIKINKVLDDLEQISNDTNLPSYIRTDIWNIASMLEEISYNYVPA